MANVQTRYSVVSKSNPSKSLKNAETRAEARLWKRQRQWTGLQIFDRIAGSYIR